MRAGPTLALAAGAALYALALPPFDCWPLAWVALVPLLLAPRAARPRTALALGALAGFLTNVGSLNRIIAPVALAVKQQTAAEKKKARPRDGESTLDTDFQIQTYIAHPSHMTDDGAVPENNR